MPDTQELPSFTVDEVPQLMDSAEVKALPPDQRAAIADHALSTARAGLMQSGSWTPDKEQSWTAFANEIHGAASPSMMEGVTEFAKSIPSALGSMAKDIAVTGAAAVDVIRPGFSSAVLGTKNPQQAPVAGAFLQSLAGATADWYGGAQAVANRALGVRSPSQIIQEAIDQGRVPTGSPEQLAGWLGAVSQHLPNVLNEKAATAIDRYANTRSPAALAQMKHELDTNGLQQWGREQMQAAQDSTGGQALPAAVRGNLRTAADPVNLAMNAMPFLRGAGAVGSAGRLASYGATVGEQAAFGAAATLREDPTASLGQVAQGAGHAAALGTLMHGVSDAVSTGIKALAGRGEPTTTTEASAMPPEVPGQPAIEASPGPAVQPGQGLAESDLRGIQGGALPQGGEVPAAANNLPQGTPQPSSQGILDTSPTITGSNAQTGAEMPVPATVQGEGSATTSGADPIPGVGEIGAEMPVPATVHGEGSTPATGANPTLTPVQRKMAEKTLVSQGVEPSVAAASVDHLGITHDMAPETLRDHVISTFQELGEQLPASLPKRHLDQAAAYEAMGYTPEESQIHADNSRAIHEQDVQLAHDANRSLADKLTTKRQNVPVDEAPALTSPLAESPTLISEPPPDGSASSPGSTPPAERLQSESPPPPATSSGAGADQQTSQGSSSPDYPRADAGPQAPYEGTTGIKNRLTDAERVARNVPVIAPTVRQTMADWWQEAQARYDADPMAGANLVRDLNRKPRVPDAVENAVLAQRKLDIQSAHQRAVDAWNAATDDAGRTAAKAEMNRTLDDLGEFDRTVKDIAGAEWGRSGRARQMLVGDADFYTLPAMMGRERAYKGSELTAAEIEGVQKRHADLTNAREALETYQNRLQQQDAGEAVHEIAAETAKELDDAQAVIDIELKPRVLKTLATELEQARARIAQERARAAREAMAAAPESQTVGTKVDYSKKIDPTQPDALPDHPRGDGTADILTTLNDEYALAKPKSAGAENDMLKHLDFGQKWNRHIYAKSKGHNPSDVASVLYERGGYGLKAPTADALAEAIAAAIKDRESARAEAVRMKMAEREAMRSDAPPPGEAANAAAPETAKSFLEEPMPEQTDFMAKFKEAASEASDRMAQRRSGGKVSMNPVGDVLGTTMDQAIIGAYHIANGAVKFAQWSGKMIEEFGETVRPHLEDLWKASQAYLDGKTKQVRDTSTRDRAPKSAEAVLNKAAQEGNGEVTHEVVRDLAKAELAKQGKAQAFLKGGSEQLPALIDAVHAQAQRLDPAITREQVQSLLPKPKQGPKTKAELDKALTEAQTQARLADRLGEVLKGKRPEKATIRDKMSDVVREQWRTLRDKMRDMGIATDPAKQLATARDAVVNRLKNSIRDLNLQLQGKQKPRDARAPLAYDAEMTKLAKERDELQAYLNDLTGPNAEGRWNARAEAAAKASTEFYKRKAAAKDLTKRTPGEKYDPNAKTRAAQDEARQAKQEWENLRDAAGLPQAEALARLKGDMVKRIGELRRRLAGEPMDARTPAKPIPLDAEGKMMRDEMTKLMALVNEMDKAPRDHAGLAEARLNKQIAEIERELDTGVRKAKVSPSWTPDARTRALMAMRDSLRDMRDAARESKRPKLSAEDLALRQYKQRMQREIYRLEQRQRTGDYSKRTRGPQERRLDTQATELLAAYNEAKLAEKQRMAKYDYQQMPKWRRWADTATRANRGLFVLSGIRTLAKLGSAVLENMVVYPAAEAVGAVLRPILPAELLKRAVREPGFSTKAERAAIVDGFWTGVKEFPEIVRTGRSQLDKAYGKPHMDDLHPSWLDYFGRLHGAFKNPMKRAEWARSMSKRLDRMEAEGADITDPSTQMAAANAAYLDGLDAILMGNNKLVDHWNMFVRSLEGSKSGSLYVTAKALQFLLPVVKVPTNYVKATGRAAFGLPVGASRLAYHMATGFEHLTPEAADSILKQIKMGSIGGALALLGFYNPQSVGGYYQDNEKRAADDVAHGTFKVGGWTVPHLIAHNPVLEAMQFGATVRRAMDATNYAGIHHTSVDRTNSLPGAVFAAGSGLIRETPLVGATTRVSNLLNTGSQGARARSQWMSSIFVPGGIRDVAAGIDMALGVPDRDTKPAGTFGPLLKALPGTRQLLPEKEAKH